MFIKNYISWCNQSHLHRAMYLHCVQKSLQVCTGIRAMFTFSVALFDKFQHSCISFSKNGFFVSVHSGLVLPIEFTQHYSTQWALLEDVILTKTSPNSLFLRQTAGHSCSGVSIWYFCSAQDSCFASKRFQWFVVYFTFSGYFVSQMIIQWTSIISHCCVGTFRETLILARLILG